MENTKKSNLIWVILVILAILILVIWVTRKSGVLVNDKSLTDAQKEEILNQLRSDSSKGSPELTDSQKTMIMADLKKSPSSPSVELTSEQKAEILKKANN